MKDKACRQAVRWLVVAGAVCSAHAFAALPPGAAAQILTLQGSGEERPDGNAQWRPAHVAQALDPGEFVRTREASRMALLFADQTQVRLNQNTVLQVKGVASAARPLTTILLEIGRAWAQTRRLHGSRLELRTPTATAGIRGTDWDIEVEPDGRTLLTVLSGSVTFSNPFGQVVVGSNEAAVAEAGKAPVRIQLAQPRDRVQWVNALVAEPLRSLPEGDVPPALLPARAALVARNVAAVREAIARAQGQASAAWLAVFAGAADVLAQRHDRAVQRLTEATRSPDAPAAAYAVLADLQIVDGDNAAAQDTLWHGLQRWPGTPQLRAQLAHAQLLAGRVQESADTLGAAQPGDPAVLWLERGALARREGDVQRTLDAYTRATRLAPQDSRGWFGLGSAQTEREDSVPARAALLRALQLEPDGAGYRGELGTLETFRNAPGAAAAAFDAALAANPGDYVALTGRGLLRLKQGQPAAALDDFLAAGVMEPRYARAKTYTGVAYWQLGRREDALVTLKQATVLDDKDPVPWMLLAQVYTDLFRAGDAVQASQQALRRMPYLKSLNQLANDQQGRANLGASLAFFGLEDWAFELAQEGYDPYWGGSHLFLADRYAGEFDKNSELFQGFLADPLAFGGSPLFSTLLQAPGTYGQAGIRFENERYRMWGPSFAVNGLREGEAPFAFFGKAEHADARGLPIDEGDAPAPFRAGAGVDTVAIGGRPTERLGLLLYATQTDIRLAGQQLVDVFGDGSPTTARIANATQQLTLGASYRWSPQAQTWVKLGYATDRTGIDGLPSPVANDSVNGTLALVGTLDKRSSELQVRHTFDAGADTRWLFGVEYASQRQRNEMAGAGPVGISMFGLTLPDTMAFSGSNDIGRRVAVFTVGGDRKLTGSVRLDGALALNWLGENVHGENRVGFLGLGAADSGTTDQAGIERKATPRVGIVFQPRPGVALRAAYQDWLRPLSVSTLAPVQTAGIPVEDRLVEGGGRHRRHVVQVGITVDGDTFVSGRLEHLRVTNPQSPGVDLRTPSLPFLEELRDAQVVNLSTTDLLEDTPSFQRGTVRGAALGVNHMFDRHVSGYAKYLYQETSSSFDDGATTVGDKRIPYLPRSTFAIGATLAGASRTYLSGRLVYRSLRFEDQENLIARPAAATVDLMGFWETADKRWVAGAAALNLLGPKSQRQTRRLVFDVRYRF